MKSSYLYLNDMKKKQGGKLYDEKKVISYVPTGLYIDVTPSIFSAS
jgi:hypothetical protein